jgi:ABC-type multidrug transport system ATPase subunit
MSHKAGVMKRRVTTVDGLSCAFDADAVTALLGHNGAGKTTTIKLILGLLRPNRGQIRCLGQPMSREHRRAIGYMPEVRKLPAALTCQEILLQQLRLYDGGGFFKSGRQALVAETLADVGLKGHEKKRVSQLSKGMGRRLAWAQATIHKPRFLILDEPFSGLDPLARHEMQAWMTKLKAQGTGMLICTHELWTVQDLCDKMFILNRGKLVFESDRASSLAHLDEQKLLDYFRVES